MARPKDIGTFAETAVVKAIRPRGFPHAERRALAGTHDLGDIVGTPGIVWEVKGGEAAKSASDGQIDKWLAETERERLNAEADMGVLVVQRRGIGAPNAHRWWAVFSGGPYVLRWYLEDACRTLRKSGYGTPLEDAA